MIRLDFPTTNNEAEYEALVSGLDLSKAAGAENIVVHCDSQVVTSQINGDYECKNDRMKRYLEEVKYRIGNLEVKFVQIPREENECADHLVKAASAGFMLVLEQVLSFVQLSSLIDDRISTGYFSDNGKQFDNSTFRDFCSELGIKNHYSLPPDALLSVLWEYRTTARTPTGETPFRLAYGTEAVILAEVGLMSYRVESYDEDKNEEAMRLQLDLVDEVRAAAEQRLALYQNLMAKHYNTKVRHRDFQVDDLVLRKVMGAARDPSQGKLGPNWEGPYRIVSWQRKGTYHLETMDEQKLQHSWNTEHLQKYYQ
ncbi:uncharacterized protein LOC126728483 [Quercus robur]|uniref:uncharacterized protein LOC126728483 n=1 Tax=Quercus robur TaxID=38942 RepID=UPI0021630A3E|nr:uncharacterized protein LOC126728483 [Quercus robur]